MKTIKNCPLVINVRGNNGSGKTHLTRQFMAQAEDYDKSLSKTGRIYMFRIKGCQRPWAVLGKYTVACGGTDTLKSTGEAIELAQEYSDRGFNVWLEGMLISTFYGKVGEFSESFGNRWIFAYLDTPLEVCLERILARRAAKGNTNPFDPEKQVAPRHPQIARTRRTIEEVHGRRTLTLPWKDPLTELMKIIRKEG
jgi:hypothetical protein